MSHNYQKEAGFTVLELLVATTVFSVILLLMTFGILQIGRIYYKGVTSGTTQETSRSIMDAVAHDIQFSGGRVFIPVPAAGYYCVGDHRYSYVLNKQLDPVPSAASDKTLHALVLDDENNCAGVGSQALNTPPLSGSSRELLGFRMRLTKFVISDRSNGLYEITLRVVYGDTELLNGDKCGSGAGSAFCATSELSTTVKKRVQ